MAPRAPRIAAAELLRALRRVGWEVKRQEGSHIQLTHPDRPGRVTVAYQAHLILKPKALASALEQAGMSIDELRSLL